jgi:hypothetical protein
MPSVGSEDMAMPVVVGHEHDLATTPPPPPPPDMTPPGPDLGPVITATIDPATVTPIDETTGSTDWAHWGLMDHNSFDHKSTGTIGTFVSLQNTMLKQASGYPIGFSWTDGSPRAMVTNTTTGVYTNGNGAGFRFTIPADTTLRTLKLYGGGLQSTLQMTAHLSDGSYPDVVQTTGDANNNFQRVLTLTYRAASSCQLTIDWAVQSATGFVHIQSLTLQ